MAKKAKRRGRPPGAKSPDKMDIGQLRQYIDRMEGLLKKKVSEQRAYFEEKLSELSGFASAKASRVMRASGRQGKGTRRKATPKYRSRKNPKILWSGPRRHAGLDARGDEGHQAEEGRFPDPEGVIPDYFAGPPVKCS